MAKHRIEINQPPKQVLHSDISFTVYSNSTALGELKISKGTIDWRPASHTKSVKWSWEQFAKMMAKK